MGRNLKKQSRKKKSVTEINLEAGMGLVSGNPLFTRGVGLIHMRDNTGMGKNSYGAASKEHGIYLNSQVLLAPEQWAYVIAHNYLHFAFGHFNSIQLPMPFHQLNKHRWNVACDIYIAKFLADMKFGKALGKDDVNMFPGKLTDETAIYEYLMEQGETEDYLAFGTGAPGSHDMVDFYSPILEVGGGPDVCMRQFAADLINSVTHAVAAASGYSMLSGAPKTTAQKAADWFINTYPLLGCLAAGFKLIESREECQTYDIQVAAVDAANGEIFMNPNAGLTLEECKFVMAHEFLHAGLLHHERCRGRDPYLWNVACDFVINGWLVDMRVGTMPMTGLYDKELSDWSAESVYDRILLNLKRFLKMDTFRGRGKGDMIGSPGTEKPKGSTTNLDDFYRDAMSQGLEYHFARGRGLIPVGMIEEIRALAVPPIPWDVELAEWFDGFFGPLERTHTYGRPSRRQSSTPDIPRPHYQVNPALMEGRTFGVVLDTSGSMDVKLLGKALGAIASYADSREVPFIRVIFCDAAAYDAGYLAPEDIAGRVEIKGRGGTRLMPGIELLEQAKDFPKKGPVLIITDGECEVLQVKREHAYLLPKGKRLPFAEGRGRIFNFE